jgi:hypothetical protein
MMKKRLGDDDASAVDLAFDRANSAKKVSGLAAIFGAPVNNQVAKRYTAVDNMLRLLAQMPAEDPPVGLAQRTCDTIFQRTPLRPTTEEGQQPHA